MGFRRNASRFPQRSGSSRRNTDWGVGPAVDNQTISASGKLLWNLGTTPGINFTVIRTRGTVTVGLQSGGVGAGFIGAHGIYMMTEDAFAVGVTAALDPLVDANSDMWLWHSFFHVAVLSATFGDGVNANAAFSRIEIDSKAMRKDFDPERVMVGVTGITELGAAVAAVNAETRQLLMQ